MKLWVMAQIVQALTQLTPLMGADMIFDWMRFNFNSAESRKKLKRSATFSNNLLIWLIK